MKRLKIYMFMKPIFHMTRISHFQIVAMGFLFVLFLNVLVFFSFEMTSLMNRQNHGENRTLELILYDADLYDQDMLIRGISGLKHVESVQHSVRAEGELNISITMKDYRFRYDTIEALPKDIKHIGIVTHKIERAIGFFKWVKFGGMLFAVSLLIIILILIKRTIHNMASEHVSTLKVIHVVGYNRYQQSLLWMRSLLFGHIILLFLVLGVVPLLMTLIINPMMMEVSLFDSFGIRMHPHITLNIMSVVLYSLICTQNLKPSLDTR